MSTFSSTSSLLNRIARLFDTRSKHAKCFEEKRLNEAAFDTIDRGVKTVALEKITGSVGRYHDFDNSFRPRQHLPGERLERIKKLIRQGHKLPPVKLYQIRDEFYVLDGNHRISAAKQLGHKQIEARILEFIPSRNTLENVLYREKTAFHDQTGIPGQIELTELGQYALLNNQIEIHRRHLQYIRNCRVDLKTAALDWYQTIYQPLRTIIEKGNLLAGFAGRTLDDLYAYISYQQWVKGQRRRYGIGIDRLIPKDMEDFREQMAEKEEFEYPEMKRQITAFVLINIRARNENRIMDKLFALEEIKEIHSVHGDIDLLVKIVLTRDLLASDTEIIAHFVQDNIRRINGVLSTQTLIPGFSKIKP